jgi:hypothetical protein
MAGIVARRKKEVDALGPSARSETTRFGRLVESPQADAELSRPLRGARAIVVIVACASCDSEPDGNIKYPPRN